MKISCIFFILPFLCLRTLSQNAFLPATVLETTGDSSLAKHFNILAQSWMHAYNTNDSAALVAMYEPEAKYISGHVKGLDANGRAHVIANFQNGIKSGGHIDAISIISIQSSCDLATLLCKYEATNNGQKTVGRNLIVVRKTDGKWLIVIHMTVV